MSRTFIIALIPVLFSACVTVGDKDREAYYRLTDERLEQIDEKLVSWSNARNGDNVFLEEVLRRDLRREAGRLVDSLKLGLAASDAKKRATCAAALGFSEDESAVSLLVELLRDAHPDVRGAAMLGICLLRSRKTPIDAMLRALEDPDPLIRRHAVLCLGFLYDPGDRRHLFDFIVKALDDTDAGVRVNATSVLEKIGEVRAAPYFARLVGSDPSGVVRRNSAVGLARLRVPKTAVDLVNALEPEMNPAVREEIVAALKKITGEKLGDDHKAWAAYLKESGVERAPAPKKTAEEVPAKK
ncbi:MAG: HEAT repeat domain-containing protein [Planctomycetota bacterium]|jgi:HEAT repeat protein